MNDEEIKQARNFTYIFITLSVIILTVVPFIRDLHNKEHVFTRLLMGTIVEITTKKDDKVSVELAFKEIQNLENIFSSYIPTSDLSKINDNAGLGPVTVSPLVVAVISRALEVSKLSEGAFDISMGAMGGLWKITDGGTVPKQSEIIERLKLVNYKNIIIDIDSSTVELKEKGMRIYLGGIAKGFIVGRAIEVLKSRGLKWGMVHAGGDMFLFNEYVEENKRAVKENFVIGIQHPRIGNELIGSVDITVGSVSTSGDYERFFMASGVRYHHILDPATGYPATLTRSATVVSLDPTLTDALSTAVFVMGHEKGIAMVEAIEGVEALVVDLHGKIHASKGMVFDHHDAAGN